MSAIFGPDPTNPGQFEWSPLTFDDAPALMYDWARPYRVGSLARDANDNVWVATANVPAQAASTTIDQVAGWQRVGQDQRGTVTYLTDTVPAAPFDATNNYGFGLAATVEPDPATIEPEPGDIWIQHPNGHIGAFV